MFNKSGFVRILFFVFLFIFALLSTSLVTAESPHKNGVQILNSVSASANLVYDSGWHSINVRPDPVPIQFSYNLRDIEAYRLVLTCRDDSSLATYDCTDHNFLVDANWHALSGTSVTAWIRGGSRPDAVRLRIYNDTPAYDSGWQTIGSRPDPIPFPFNHNLGGNPDEYHVVLICKDDTSLGTYNCTDSNFNVNAHWYGLTSTSVSAWIDNGTRPDEVRLRIYTQPATYDSGWQVIGSRPDPLPLPFNHNLGGDSDNYELLLECRDDTSLATYDCTDQNFNGNAHWYALTETAVTVWADNSLPDEVRLRIWTAKEVYLPVIMRD